MLHNNTIDLHFAYGPVFGVNYTERLKQILAQISKDYHFNIIAMEVMPDHVHMLIEAPPKYAPSKIVGYLKGISSRMLREEFLEEIKKYIWKENTLWA